MVKSMVSSHLSIFVVVICRILSDVLFFCCISEVSYDVVSVSVRYVSCLSVGLC